MTVPRIVLSAVLILAFGWESSAEAGADVRVAAADESGVFGEWSKPVGGLQGRLSGLGFARGFLDGVYLELRNAGEQPIAIESLSVAASGKDFPWHLQVELGGEWKDCTWGSYEVRASEPDAPKPKARSAVVLRHGETALVQIDARFNGEVRKAQRIRVVFVPAA